MSALLDEFGRGDAQAREESWRYSRNALRALEQEDFVTADTSTEVPRTLIDRFDWPETRCRRLVFVNGAFSKQHSDWSALRAVRPDISVEITNESASIVIPAGRMNTLHLVYISIPGSMPSRWRCALTVKLNGGRAELIEQHVGADGTDVFGALTSEFSVAANVDLRVLTVGDLPDSVSLYRRAQATVQQQARYRSTHAIFGGRLQRFDLACDLVEVKASCEQRGVFAPRARQHIDVQLDVRHLARDTVSDVLWRGVADQRGRGILRGAITVAAGADGADVQLQTKNLLLSPHAEIDAQPVLEIYADEVKAAHGATVGQLDERALFYLRSRGVPLTAARNLLIAGFCREALQGLDDFGIAQNIDALLAARLPQAPGASA